LQHANRKSQPNQEEAADNRDHAGCDGLNAVVSCYDRRHKRQTGGSSRRTQKQQKHVHDAKPLLADQTAAVKKPLGMSILAAISKRRKELMSMPSAGGL
jgi:hypothetical protein